MRSELSLGALALALSLAGCGGGAVLVRNDLENANTKELLARLKFPRTTLTLKQLGETYSEGAWSKARRGFEPVYHPITEADVFASDYLREVQAKRRGFFAKREKKMAAERRQAEKVAAKERKLRVKADARAAAKAKKAEAIRKKAERAPAAAPTPSE